VGHAVRAAKLYQRSTRLVIRVAGRDAQEAVLSISRRGDTLEPLFIRNHGGRKEERIEVVIARDEGGY
jgi:hypothetical protein